MADRTIRAVYEVTVDRAVNNMRKAGNEMGKLEKQSAQLEENLKDLSGTTVNPKIDVEISKAQKAIKDFKGTLDDVRGYKATPKIDAEIGDSISKLEDIGQKLRKLEQQKPSVHVVMEAAKAQSEIEQLTRKISTLQGARARVQVTADAREAVAQLSDLENKARALKGLKASMDIVADAKQAQAVMSQVKSEAKSLDGMKVNIGIKADKPDFSGITGGATKAGREGGVSAGKSLIDGLNSTPVVGAVVGILGAAGIAGVAAMNKGFEKISIDTKIGAQLNLSQKEVDKYSRIAGQSYAKGFGDSYASAMDGIKTLKLNNLIGAKDTEAEMQSLNKILLNTANLLDEDISTTAEAAGAMMKNGLAKNSQEAFDIIQRGMEAGLNRSGDWIDTLREYPSMFQSLGLSAQDMGNLLSQSMEAGARNTDFAADALKEFSIRAQDGSTTSAAGFQAIGLNAEEMTAKFARGGKEARDGLQQVLTGLNAIEDPVARNAAGVALFGTKWEDLGNGAQITAMNLEKTGGAFDNVAGAAERAMTRMESSVSNKAQSAARTMEVTWQNVSASVLAAFEPQISGFANYISQNQAKVLEFAKSVIDGVLTMGIGLAEFAASGYEALGGLVSGFGGLITVIGKAVQAYGTLNGNPAIAQLGKDMQTAGQDAKTFGDRSAEMANGLRNNVIPGLEQTRDKFNNIIDPAIAAQKAQDAVNQISSQLDTLSATLDAKDYKLKINGDTMPAKDALAVLMTEIQASPDGMVNINGNKVPAEEALATFLAAADTEQGDVTISANTAQAQTDIDNFKYTIQAPGTEIPVDANTGAAGSSLDQFRVTANNTKGTVAIDGNSQPGIGTLGQFKVGIDQTRGSVAIDGNPQPGNNALGQYKGNIDKTRGTVAIDGNAQPGIGTLGQYKTNINSSKGVVTIDGNKSPGEAQRQGLVSNINSSSGKVNVGANTDNASSAVQGFIGWASRQSATVNIVRNIVERFTRGRANGGIIDGRAHGGLLPGRAAGGWVDAPRTLPGVDNVLYPLARGGQVLNQPLAGGEFVVNAKDSARNRGLLEYLNKGGTFSASSASASVDTSAIANAVAGAIMSAPIIAEVKDSRTAAAIVSMGQRHIR